MLLLARGTSVLHQSKACGFVFQRIATVIERIAGGSAVVRHDESKLCHGYICSTSSNLSAKRYNTHDAFAQVDLPKQGSCYFWRQREGLSAHAPAGEQLGAVVNTGESLVIEPTEEEKWLASQLKKVGNRKNGHGQWQKVYAEYSGLNPLVLTAAMQAALKQGNYEEGYEIYRRIRHMTLPTYTISMKLLGKLGQHDEIERLWGQLMKMDIVGQPEASGRIDAAADNGDIQAAVRVLHYLQEKRLEADKLHFSSAINACANAKDADRAQSAQRLFDEMLAVGLKPDIATYTNLLRALANEPRQRLLNLLTDVKNQNLTWNGVFAETFLFIFLQSPQKGVWTKVDVIASHLRKLSLADVQTAKEFVDELKRSNVKLNKSCRLIDEAIQSVLQEARKVMGQSP
ncbi:Pentatricopeptide repeat-containing protein At1g51965 [Durusdinium trenchii]|uniref:Mitochondrial n=1 Tax=Durusdinium trenchii TaxID=1381693 RepID=A0ABP0NHD0_9DINO